VTLVIDASVAIKWFVGEDRRAFASDALGFNLTACSLLKADPDIAIAHL
jgi:predicted nucleic acid-binding protein